MTETIQRPKQNKFLKTYAIVAITILGLFAFSFLVYIAYVHGDGTPYSSGLELGKMLREIFNISPFRNGIGLGSIIAVLASWDRNKSIRWSILHGIFGWAYVIYFAFTRNAKQTDNF